MEAASCEEECAGRVLGYGIVVIDVKRVSEIVRWRKPHVHLRWKEGEFAYPVEPVDWPRFFGEFKPLLHFYSRNPNSALKPPINREAGGEGPNLKPAC